MKTDSQVWTPNYRPYGWPRALLLLAAVFFISSCAGITGTTSPRPDEAVPGAILQARSLLEKLENANEALHSFKGVGTVRIQKENSTWSSRLVLAGASPDKLRVEVLAVPGRSAASMATDGEWLYFDPHTPGQFYKKSASNVHLDPILSIPIPAGDLIALLSGKTPIRPHHHVTLAPGGPDGEGRVLTLSGRWRRILQKIHFDNNGDAPRMIEIFRGSGVLKYRAVFEETRLIEGFRTPSLLTLSSKDGAALRLRLHQYHVNAPVNPSMFVLAPPQ